MLQTELKFLTAPKWANKWGVNPDGSQYWETKSGEYSELIEGGQFKVEAPPYGLGKGDVIQTRPNIITIIWGQGSDYLDGIDLMYKALCFTKEGEGILFDSDKPEFHGIYSRFTEEPMYIPNKLLPYSPLSNLLPFHRANAAAMERLTTIEHFANEGKTLFIDMPELGLSRQQQNDFVVKLRHYYPNGLFVLSTNSPTIFCSGVMEDQPLYRLIAGELYRFSE